MTGSLTYWPRLGAIVFLGVLLAAPAPSEARPRKPPPRASTGADASRAADAFQSGLKLKREGKLSQACEAYKLAVKATPSWALAQFELAQCRRLLGDLDGTASTHLDAAAAELQAPPIFIEQGRLAEDRGDLAAAKAAYAKAAELAPAEVRAQAGLVRLTTAKDGREGLQRIRAYLTRYPDDVAGWRKLAEVAEGRRKHKDAEQALDKVIELSTNKRAAIAALGAFGQRARKKKVVARAKKLMAAAK